MSILDATIGWLAPATCVGCGATGASLCVGCSSSSILPFGERCYLCQSLSSRSRTCPSCRHDSPRYVWISCTYDSLPKQLISVFKFGHQRSAADEISILMVDTLRRFNSSVDVVKSNYLVVPVPTATNRVRERGFDHSRLLAKKIAGRLELDFSASLRRLGQANQVGARRAQRLNQQNNSYRVLRQDKIDDRNILIIDDVVTTGATLRAVTKVLRAAGARRIDALILAKSQ